MRTLLYAVSCLLLFGVHLVAQNTEKEELTQVEKNIRQRMVQLDLGGSVYVIAPGRKSDRVYAQAVLQGGADRLWMDIHQNKKRWHKNPEVWTWISHRGAVESWRTSGNASLQATISYLSDGTRLYELDIDNWPPRGIKTPINSVRHLVWEVWRNNVFHQSTNEGRIARTLSLIDERSQSGN